MCMVDTTTSYRLIASDMTRSLQRVSKEPLVERETAYFRENIGNVKSLDDFMADSRLYNYALKAFGLEDMAYAKAFIRKILTEGVTDKESMANQLTDKRYKEFATVFDFADKGRKPPRARRCSRARSTDICARRWKSRRAARTTVCGWRSISSARRRR